MSYTKGCPIYPIIDASFKQELLSRTPANLGHFFGEKVRIPVDFFHEEVLVQEREPQFCSLSKHST